MEGVGRMEKLKFIDLFCGIGGFRLSLESFGHHCVFSSDSDKDARETYIANFGESPVGDITKIEASVIPEHQILCGGFPCQPFSISGNQGAFKMLAEPYFTKFCELQIIINQKSFFWRMSVIMRAMRVAKL